MMSNDTSNKQSKWIYIRWLLLRGGLVIYDILAVNISVYIALITRFYVARQFHAASSQYFIAFGHYAPFYTLFCLIVFGLFKLYTGLWRHAGVHDLRHIVWAGIVAAAGHVAGTLAFGIRMPITIYLISGVILLCLTGFSRFSYRIYEIVIAGFSQTSSSAVKVLVVGIGGTARNAVRQMEHEKSAQVACMLNFKNYKYGARFDGIPVVNGVENIKEALTKYKINLVVFASNSLTEQMRLEIKEICKELDIETKEYTGFIQSTGNYITLRNIAECSTGPVELIIDGIHQRFDSGEQAVLTTAGKYIVKSISAGENALMIELEGHDVILNDINADWVKQQKEETGEEVSFF